MKHLKKYTLFAFFALLLVIATACGQADQNNEGTDGNPPVTSGEGESEGSDADSDVGSDEGSTEDDIAPVQPDEKNTVKKTVTLFFADQDLMEMYRVSREIEVEQEEDLPQEALQAWMEGPGQDGLANLVPPDVVIESLEIKDGVARVSFSGEIKNANLGSSGELFLLDQLALIMQQFGADSTQILVEGEIEESLLGHVSTGEPYKAPNPENYEEWSS